MAKLTFSPDFPSVSANSEVKTTFFKWGLSPLSLTRLTLSFGYSPWTEFYNDITIRMRVGKCVWVVHTIEIVALRSSRRTKAEILYTHRERIQLALDALFTLVQPVPTRIIRND